MFVMQGFAYADDSLELKTLSQIIPGDYHQSIYYRINDVSTNNNNYVFTVESDYGNFRIESVGLTLKYLMETQIVSQVLNQITSDADSQQVDLKSQLRIRAESAIDILSSPLGTASNLAGQLARNLGDTFAGNSPYIVYNSNNDSGEEFDPNLEIHKRNISSQLGLDVYSSNYIVQHMLTQLARERSAGNISSGSVLVNVNKNYEKRIFGGRLDREIDSVLRMYTVENLYQHNTEILQKIGMPEDISKNFLMHKAYSPSLQTVILKYLQYLYQLENQQEYMGLTLLATDEVTASSFARVLKMIAWYSDNVEAVKTFKLLGNNISVISENNNQVVIIPDDIFYLNDANTELIKSLKERARINKYSGVKLIVYGSISDKAKAEMLNSGIDYIEQYLF